MHNKTNRCYRASASRRVTKSKDQGILQRREDHNRSRQPTRRGFRKIRDMGKTIDQVAPIKTLSSTSDLSVRRRHGRTVNAVADFLRSQLRVPNVYIDPSGTNLSRVDVLAADAAGSGDIHAVHIELLTKPTGTLGMKLYVELVKRLPSHYKYLAIPRNITNISADLGLFSADGIGRVGILIISESEDHLPQIDLAIRPERFRVEPTELARVERFLNSAKPDMYVRL